MAENNEDSVDETIDPDLPSSIARQVAEDLPPELTTRVSSEVSWKVESIRSPFEAMAPRYSRLLDRARQRVADTGWDLAICLTDMPLRRGRDIVVAAVSAIDRVAVISLPALGGLALRIRAREVIVPVAAMLTEDMVCAAGTATTSRSQFRRGTFGIAGAKHTQKPSPDVGVEITRTRGAGLPRLLAGMIRANRPWQLMLGLSRALAGALASAMFGLLYSNSWQLAAALNPVRLAGVALAAIAALVLWLIAGHGLRERSRRGGELAPSVTLRNLGTVLTLTVGAVVFFLTLFAVSLAGATLIIPPDYLARIVGHPASFSDFVTVALMSSVVGTVAGGIGSGLENDATVRRVAYGHRDAERWWEMWQDTSTDQE